jgi:hypothetical protein
MAGGPLAPGQQARGLRVAGGPLGVGPLGYCSSVRHLGALRHAADVTDARQSDRCRSERSVAIEDFGERTHVSQGWRISFRGSSILSKGSQPLNELVFRLQLQAIRNHVFEFVFDARCKERSCCYHSLCRVLIECQHSKECSYIIRWNWSIRTIRLDLIKETDRSYVVPHCNDIPPFITASRG